MTAKKIIIPILCLLLFLSASNVYAQDSLSKKFHFRDIFILSPKIDTDLSILFRLDDRTTVIRNESIDITGLQFGLQKKHWKYWLGFAFINAPSKTRIIQEKAQNASQNDTIRFDNDLKFVTFSAEYIVLWRRYYELSFATGAGFGVLEINRDNISQNTSLSGKSLFVPIEPVIKLVIKPTRWAGLSATIGYRETLSLAANNFNYRGWCYSYGVSFFLGNIFTDVKRMIK